LLLGCTEPLIWHKWVAVCAGRRDLQAGLWASGATPGLWSTNRPAGRPGQAAAAAKTVLQERQQTALTEAAPDHWTSQRSLPAPSSRDCSPVPACHALLSRSGLCSSTCSAIIPWRVAYLALAD